MIIYYQDVDITNMVRVADCVVNDTCGKRCDGLTITFENAAGWYGWQPQEDDRILVSMNGYDTGTMYVNTIYPENGQYRILATSLPCKARKKAYKSFYGKTLEGIMRACALEGDMDFRIYGIDPDTIIPYIERNDQTCGAFLDYLLTLEGAVLKTVNGRYAAIGLEYAQGIDPSQTLEVYADQDGVTYERDGMTLRSITIMSPYASATAEDTSVGGTHLRSTISGTLPVMNSIQAKRWARGKLSSINRKSEKLTLNDLSFNPGFTAMSRIDITGNTDANGAWIVEEAIHDFYEEKTSAVLRRCIYV